jgi:hypothetical protein
MTVDPGVTISGGNCSPTPTSVLSGPELMAKLRQITRLHYPCGDLYSFYPREVVVPSG